MRTTLAALAVSLALPSAAATPSAGRTTLPLPGYSGDAPPLASALGPEEDPLASLAAEASGEDLRDAVAAPPSALWLQTGLRSPRPADRVAAVFSAAVPRNVAAVPHLRGVLLRLDEAPEVRAAAAVALGRIGDGVALRGLIEGLKDPSPQVRVASALSIGRLRADGAASALMRSLAHDSSWWVRHAAAIALGRAGKSFSVSALEQCLTGEPRWQVRLQAVKSLQEIGGPRAADAVSLALTDPDSGVRAASGQALAAIGGEPQRRALESALKVENDATTRGVLQSALARLGATLTR
ncbi:MAG: HEAT repeat domain-containing protein [Elusimicrobiota bacterium]|nr:HEAT repeat domain-containing protein [Elusimicrobiota bacterium]